MISNDYRLKALVGESGIPDDAVQYITEVYMNDSLDE